ncbi:hypothetical protein KEJ47_07920 [Candidatus Bathyarchaeota archaeon]|nr:hypothetical protein [Candidatus Bathyarchaeota archaeon]
MVLPVKVFEVKGEVSLDSVEEKLRGFHEEESYESEDGSKLSLSTDIFDLKREGELIKGTFSRDYLRRRQYKRKTLDAPVTEEAPFWISRFRGRTFLITSAPSVARGVKKLLTNHVANKISEIVYNKMGYIVEARIPSERLQRLHESNPQATKLIWFDDVDIPGVKKLALAGSGLADTGLYRDYLKHGKIWYVVFESQRRGIVVGITRNCVVTLFSKSTMEDFIKYIVEEVLSLVE